MKKVAILHPSLNFCGGAEKVALSIIEILNNSTDVSLFTIDRTSWDRIENLFNNKTRPKKEYYIIDNNITASKMNIIKSLKITEKYLLFLFKELKEFDLKINTYGDFDILNYFSDIAYSGFPFSMSHLFPEIAPYPLKNRPTQKTYYIIIKILKFLPVKRKLRFIANSSFTEKLIRQFYGSKISINIIHPPCDVKKIVKKTSNTKRENNIVIISRFSGGKNLELIPKIAKTLNNWNFNLIGSVSSESERLIEQIKTKIKLYNLQDRVNILINVKRFELIDILSSSKIYLHLMKNEPFGMSIVESMASGCVPIIHTSGGGWYDIFEKRQGYYGFGYKDFIEIPKYIKTLEKQKTFELLSKRSQNRASVFDEKNFKAKFKKYLKLTEFTDLNY